MNDLKSWNGVNWSEREIGDLYILFGELRLFLSDDKFHLTTQQVYGHCYNLFSRFPICLIEVTEHAIIRARRNFNGELFSHQYEISYNKQCPNSIKLGRFNRPREAVFYGSLPFISDRATFLATAMSEACKDLYDDLNTESSFDFTVGLWDVKPFMAVCLCYDDEHLIANERMANIILEFRKEIKNRCNHLSAEFILECLTYFSKLSSTKCLNNKAYLVLTAFFCTVRNIYAYENMDIEGIIYPSAITDHKGLNIVLTPEVVDNNLHLKQVLMQRFDRWNNDRKQYDVYPITEIVNVEYRSFQFSNIGDKRNYPHLFI